MRLEGKPIGISEGGLLNVVTREVEIECLPTEIPEAVTADISELGVGQAVHVSNLNLPSGSKMISLGHLTVAVVNKEEEKATAITEAAPAAAGKAAPAASPAAAKAPAKK